MRILTTSRSLRIALLASVMLLIASTAMAQSDPMAKWKPTVGSVFTYDRVYDSYGPAETPHIHDTLTFTIISTNHFYDSTRPSVVVVSVGNNLYYYDYEKSIDTGVSTLPIVIETAWNGIEEGPLGYPFELGYGFPKFPDSTTKLGSQALTLYTAGTMWTDRMYNDETTDVAYSPTLRWFYSFDGKRTDNQYTHDTWHYSLLTAQVASAGVALPASTYIKSQPIQASVTSNGKSVDVDISLLTRDELEVVLLDPLARPIRSWSLDAQAGESEVHLNVADVPSGVYFLKLSAPGVEDVRKVVIAH